ncbi:MAG: general secretion pathway protein G [Pseudomonadales bacterium]|jgi:general secretion pathway protein G
MRSNGMQDKKQAGFTLIEIMVVVVIISVLVGMLAPNIVGRADEARVTAAKFDISALVEAFDMYKLDNYQYPSTDQGLQALISKPSGSPDAKNWREGGYIKKRDVPKDPWGNEYLYISPGVDGPYDLFSFAADGAEGGEGDNADIGNWNL